MPTHGSPDTARACYNQVMADDDIRVETRLNLVGRGSGTTPERIAELEARAKDMDRMRRKPTPGFGALIKVDAEPEKKPARPRKERKLTATPKPGMVHPKQRETFGRNDDDDVIIKG
jgi:hypothetical protein